MRKSRAKASWKDPLQYFPYTPREGQIELMEFIQDAISKKKNVCIHAATGFGKTPVILAALLPYVIRRRKYIVWAVRTGNETDRPIEELKEIVKRRGVEVFGLSLRGKRDMCLIARELEVSDYNSVSILCKKKRKDCPYYRRVQVTPEILEEPRTFSEILTYAKETKMCPYFLQISLLDHVQVVSLSYNYIIRDDYGWIIRGALPLRDTFLVVDEAHNLQFACANINSDRITLNSVERAISELRKFSSSQTGDLGKKLLKLRKYMVDIGGNLKKDQDATFDPQDMLEKTSILYDDMKLMIKLGDIIHTRQINLGKAPRSSLYHLGIFLANLLDCIDEEGIAFLVYKENGNVVFETWDMRAAEVLAYKWKQFYACIFCSGTLSPLGAFADTVGLENWSGKVITSFADTSKVMTLILKTLTTKGEELEPEMADKYLKAIKMFLENFPYNAAIFCASYRIQNDLLPGIKEITSELGRPLFVEVEGMSGDAAKGVLEEFKQCAHKGRPAVLCATMTGRFSEGADFPGKELEGVFLVGIPFEKMTTRTRLYIDYYIRLYGEEKGLMYSYVIPALRRASQAIGRVIRSKEDCGLFICGDERYAYMKYFQLLPDYVQETARVIKPEYLPSMIKLFERKTSS